MHSTVLNAYFYMHIYMDILICTFNYYVYVHCYYVYMTGPEKTGLIYKKYTYSYYGTYLSFYTLYFNSVNFNEQLRNCCTYDEIFINILSSQ